MKPKAIISEIDPGSIADDLGWQPGDEIVSINGHSLNDVLDYRFYSTDDLVVVVLKRGTVAFEFEIEKEFDEPLGAGFKDPLFDGIRFCGAKCMFCFVEQLPKGLRAPLYVKDDDYRLSFLDGSFVTLGNLSAQDLKKIKKQRLSPLYVSVHTTDHELRQRMIGRRAPDILHQIDELASGHIHMHTQIVLCPGINDGEVLKKTVSDLADRHPAVESVAVVPVGLTGFRDGLYPLAGFDKAKAEEVVTYIEKCQKAYLKDLGTRFIWPADEFYLMAGRNVPGNAAYEGYPQFENGVGLTRSFLNGVPASKRILSSKFKGNLRVTIITGRSAEPLLKEWAESLNVPGLEIEILAIKNHTLGESVTVAGLMCGKDIISQVDADKTRDLVLIPETAVRSGMFLDDVTIELLQQRMKCPVIAVDITPQAAAKAIINVV